MNRQKYWHECESFFLGIMEKIKKEDIVKDEFKSIDGIAKLLRGEEISLVPKGNRRETRHKK